MAVVTDTIAAPARSGESRSETIAFLVMVAVLVIAPFFIYPLFLMQALCFALFACAFNLLIGYVRSSLRSSQALRPARSSD